MNRNSLFSSIPLTLSAHTNTHEDVVVLTAISLSLGDHWADSVREASSGAARKLRVLCGERVLAVVVEFVIGAPSSWYDEKFCWELDNQCRRVRLLKVLQSELPGKEAAENIALVLRQKSILISLQAKKFH